MNSAVTSKCPNCGAGLLFCADKQKFSCEFCLSDFTEYELNQSVESNGNEDGDREFADSTDTYSCQSCGAEVITDKNTAAGFCLFCHNPVVMSKNVSGIYRPSKIIPFKFSKEEATEHFVRFAKSKWFVPRSYLGRDHISKMTGVYYPFWLTDADTDSAMSAIGKRVRTWRSGDYRYTETKVYDVRRRGRIHFEDITTSALSTEDKAMLEGILPYPIEEYRDFSMPYLQGFLAKKRDVETVDIGAEVKRRMDSYASDILMRTARGYSTVDIRSLDVAILSAHWEYSLMPIWILTYKKKKKTYVYAMNGSTGKIYGELPISWPKLILFGLGVLVLAALVAFGIGWLITGGGAV